MLVVYFTVYSALPDVYTKAGTQACHSRTAPCFAYLACVRAWHPQTPKKLIEIISGHPGRLAVEPHTAYTMAVA